jgi:hypothetical protein
MSFAPQDIDVEHHGPPSLALLEFGNPNTKQFMREGIAVVVVLRRAFALAIAAICVKANKFAIAWFWRRRMEAGGVEPPSEKRYGPKTTCLSHSIWFADVAWNAQDAPPTSPINLAS